MINDYIKNLPHCFDFDKDQDFLNVENYYDFLNSLSISLQPEKILEIGVRYGYSGISFCLNSNVKRYVGIDYDFYDSKSISYAEENFRYLQKNKKDFSFCIIKMNTQELNSLDFLNEEKFNLIHIDGDHSSEGSYRDMTNFWNVLRVGGYMLIDDSIFYQDVRGSIQKVLKELNEPNFEIASLRGTWVIKKTKEKMFPIQKLKINDMTSEKEKLEAVTPIEKNFLSKLQQAEQNSGRKIILKQEQSPGDILSFTRSIIDFKLSFPKWEIDVRSPCPEIWENCPHLTPLNDNDPDVEVFKIGYPDINISGWDGLHYTDAFRNDIENQLKIRIKKTGFKPELWISDVEKTWINHAEVAFGWKGPFWLLNAGCKPDNELKQYHRYQEVVDLLNDYFKDKVKIIQIGHKDHNHPSLKGVLSLVGQTDLRQLIRLAYWSDGLIGPLSFQFILGAALSKPGVVIAGGKEGVNWHIYPNIRHLCTNGAIDCCTWDGCWLGGSKGECKNIINDVPKCFEMIKPYMVADAVKMYYEGGMLKMKSS